GMTAISRFKKEAEITLNQIKSLIKDIKPVTEKEREIDDQKCILCYTCYRVCPHGALEPDPELDAMQINQLSCEGCDACIAHCPASAISIVEEGDKRESSGLKVYLCENSAEIALNNVNREQFKDITFNTIPCSSSLEKQDLYRELKNKEDRLLILGCFQESCKHINGDQRGERIINQVKNTLSQLELEEDRLLFKRMSPRMSTDLNLLLSRWKEGKLD
ncbi:MAG: hydrogenase iron-sulfur subunit, partial [Halanaerobiales bacterium]